MSRVVSASPDEGRRIGKGYRQLPLQLPIAEVSRWSCSLTRVIPRDQSSERRTTSEIYCAQSESSRRTLRLQVHGPRKLFR
jgi:hypothetical protein